MLIDVVSALLKPAILALPMATAVLLSGAPAVADIHRWVDRAGQVHYADQPPPAVEVTQIRVRPNVIETDPGIAPAFRNMGSANPKAPVGASAKAGPGQRQDIQAYIAQCRNNRGVDCEREAHAMIDGPATVLFPGDPAIVPRPDLKPPPPGLPLEFEIWR